MEWRVHRRELHGLTRTGEGAHHRPWTWDTAIEAAQEIRGVSRREASAATNLSWRPACRFPSAPRGLQGTLWVGNIGPRLMSQRLRQPLKNRAKMRFRR